VKGQQTQVREIDFVAVAKNSEREWPSIGDYGVIGDCKSAALVSKSGSIDWLCWPNFSSGPVLSSLIDPEDGGTWSVAPKNVTSIRRRYVGNTNVLETTFDTNEGTVVLTDFMPVADEQYQRWHLVPERMVWRMVQCKRGSADVHVVFRPANGFEEPCPPLRDRDVLGLRVELTTGMLALYSDLKWNVDGVEARAVFTMKAGDSRSLALTHSTEAPSVMPTTDEADLELRRTLDWWEKWSSKFTYKGPYSAEVQRSILTLKLLQFAPTGAFVAAVTTSLPEHTGGALNWDYRYCWLRDASFNLQALCATGYGEEAAAFLEWMLHATRLTQPKLMTCYDLFGNPVPKEKELLSLGGYRSSQPVRVGNTAGEQHQLDTYGEVICGASKVIRGRRFADRETQKVLMRFGKFVAEHWEDTDAGIWESRDEPIIHTHSRLLCWVALEELVRLHDDGFVSAVNVDTFKVARDKIRKSIEDSSWSTDSLSYTSEPGSSGVDATLLLFALHNFAESGSERLQRTYAKVQDELSVGDGLLLRNLPKAGSPSEGAFGICGFWAAEFLAMGGGSFEDAEAQFGKMLKCANDLGLYAEENEFDTLAPLGNFPQSFTHVGLINAALALEKRAGMSPGGSACTV
jgi:GH15 family glucan-1,4-alpha-glucosidase